MMAESRTVLMYLEASDRTTQLQTLLESAGFEVLVAQSSDEIRRIGEQRDIGCLVITQYLSGFLSGIEIVERIRRSLLNPAVILIGDLQPDQHALLRELKVDHVLSSTSALETIRDCIKASFVVSGPTALRIPLGARQIAEASDCFKPLPQIVLRVMTRLGDEACDLAELVQDISTDPRLTAELLRITNSSSSGLRCKVNHVGDAVKYLGFRRSIALIVALAQKSIQGDGLRKLPAWVDPWFRTRAVLTASVGFAFADQHLKGSAETAYVTGLLQDLGILALAHHIGPHYLQLIERCRKVGQLQLLIGEHQQFNVDHAQVSAALLQKWGVPVPFIRQVLHHHDDKPSQLTEFEVRLGEVMQFAESVADMHDAPSPQRQRRLNRLGEAFAGLGSDSSKSCLARAVSKTVEFEQLLKVPVPPEKELRDFIAGLTVAPQVSEGEEELNRRLPDSLDSRRTTEPQRKSLLVIDDDEEMIELIEAILSEFPLQLLAATSAERAAGLIANCQGVLCDIHLPGASGVDFVTESRQRGYQGAIVMMSGDRTRDSVIRSAQNGATGYLLKPFTPNELVSVLRRHRLVT